LTAQGAQLLTLPLYGASQNLPINSITVCERRDRLLKTIQQAYGKAPQFPTVFPLLEEIVLQREDNLARFLDYGLRRVCDFLGLHPRWHLSSNLRKNAALRGQEKILAISDELRAYHYIN